MGRSARAARSSRLASTKIATARSWGCSWADFFRWLKGCGLHGVDLVVSDNHGGLTSAVRVQFQWASWQRCQMHLSSNVSSAAPKAVQEELHARVRAIFEAPDLETARVLLAQVVADYERVAPTAIATLERGFEDATAVLALPRPLPQAAAHRQRAGAAQRRGAPT